MQRKVFTKFPNIYNPGRLEVSTYRCQFLSFPQICPLLSRIVSHVSSITLGFLGQSLPLFCLPLHTFPGGQLSPWVFPHPLALSTISIVSSTGPFKGDPVFAQVTPSVKNVHPSSCFNRRFLRPHPNIKSIVKSFQLCPLHTVFIWHYDIFIMTMSASPTRLRAFRAMLSCASESPKDLGSCWCHMSNKLLRTSLTSQ